MCGVLRGVMGWSQEDLAFETEIDRTYISGIERGVRNPSLDMIVKLGEDTAGDAFAIARAIEAVSSVKTE